MKKWLLLLCLPLLCGCSHTYLERQIYPICLSVDVLDDGAWMIGLQAPQSGGGGSTGYDILTASGKSPMDALRVLANSIPYPLHFGQIRLCLVAYDAAQGDLAGLLKELFELPTMRPNAYVMVAMGSALDVMRAQKPDLGMRLSTHLNLLFERLHRENTLPDSTLSTCVRELADGRGDLLLCLCAINARLDGAGQDPQPSAPSGDAGGAAPAFSSPWADELLPPQIIAGMLPRDSVNPVEYVGSAAIRSGSVAGVLSARQTQLAVRAVREARIRAQIRPSLQLEVLVPGKSDLAQSTQEIAELISRLQAMGSDALGFGRAASKAFFKTGAWQDYRFRERYPTASVVVKAQ